LIIEGLKGKEIQTLRDYAYEEYFKSSKEEDFKFNLTRNKLVELIGDKAVANLEELFG